MPAATLSLINPSTGKPGTALVLTGTDFAPGAAVRFSGLHEALDGEAVSFVDGTELHCRTPEFDGSAQTLQVVVVNPGELASSPALAYMLPAWPPVAASLPLCSLRLVKSYMGLEASETARDAQMRAMIGGASRAIENFCKRSFGELQTITGEVHDGDGSSILRPKQTPIVSVEALSVSGVAVEAAEYKIYREHIAFDAGQEYEPRLRTAQRQFPAGTQNVSIDYTAGFAEIPADLADACAQQVIYLMNTLGKTGIDSETNSAGQLSTSYQQKPLAPQVQLAVLRYRRTKVKVV